MRRTPCAGPVRERLRPLVVVRVRVRDHDAVDRAAGRVEHGLEVLSVVRPRVDHPALDDVGVRAVEREGGRVGRAHACDAVGDAFFAGHIRIMPEDAFAVRVGRTGRSQTEGIECPKT